MGNLMNAMGRLIAAAAILIHASAMGADAPGGIAGLLPAADEIPGWAVDGAPLDYGPDNLWEYIDGSAEMFLGYNFRHVLVQDYLSATEKGLKVELYEFESPLMAFGLYSQLRSPGLTAYDIGNEAFGDDYSINFWKDSCYVRVSIFEKDADLLAAAERFAAAIAGRIAKEGTLPGEINAFPGEGIVPIETTFIPQSVLGREKFPPAFAASYQLGEERGRLYLSTLADSASARKTFDWYAAETNAAIRSTEGPYGAYVQGVGTDQYQGDILVFQYGKWLGVVTGLKTGAKNADDLARKTIEKLAKLR